MGKTSGKLKSKNRKVEEELRVPRVLLKRMRSEQSGKAKGKSKKTVTKGPKAGTSKSGWPSDLPAACPFCGETRSR